MEIFQVALILATLLCSLVAGFVFAFAVVVMPGIGDLKSGEFIRAFQKMDGIIQNNQPVFTLVWIGSVITLIIAAVLGVSHLDATGVSLLVISTIAYLLGVQLPTFTINIPLNNKLQSLNVDAMDASAQQSAREAFEGRWDRWNVIRTAISCAVTLMLIVLVLRH